MPLEKRRVNASLAYILVLSSFVAALNTQTVRAISNRTPLLVLPSTNNDRPSQGWDIAFTLRRGGAIEDSDDAYDLDESEFEEEDDSEDEDDVKLSASAVAAARKAKSKESKQSKKKVNASLKKSTKKKRSSPLKKVPYILRAILNPFTVFAMTKGYFLSLFDIDYMKQVSNSRELVLISLRNMHNNLLKNHSIKIGYNARLTVCLARKSKEIRIIWREKGSKDETRPG